MGLLSKIKKAVDDKSNGSSSSSYLASQQTSLDGPAGSSSRAANTSDEFVTASDGKLYLGGKPFRFAGLNAPELLDGDVNGPFEYGHTFQTLALPGAFGTAVTRTYTLRINSKNICRGHIKGWNREWNDWEWDGDRLNEFDRVLAEARKWGVKLIFPIINQDTGEDTNWVGSYADLIRMRKGLSDNAETKTFDWWTDHEMIESFKLIIDKLLNRVNHVNGIRIGDDATILAFETGNEMNHLGMRPAPASWTLTIARHLKSRAPKTLVMDGSFARTENVASSYPIEVLQSPDVDILSYHYYGSGDARRLRKDLELVVGKHRKVFIAGEVGFFAQASEYGSFLADLDKHGGAGALVWSLRPASAKGGFKTHGEGDGNWSFHIPGWSPCPHAEFDARERALISTLRTYSYKLNNEKPPSQHPVPPAPEKIWLECGGQRLIWTSAPWAHSYELILRDVNTGHEHGRRQVWDCVKEGQSGCDLATELKCAPRERLGVSLRGVSLDGVCGPESNGIRLG